MRVRRLHPLERLSPAEAIALQRTWAPRVVRRGSLPRRLEHVAAIDCSPAPDGTLHACVVLCRAPDWRVVEEAHAAARPGMPYVSGLLSFRELPVELAALRRLRGTPQVLLVDGQGVAHPRRLGIASHLGLFLDVPTVGVGKSRLCGAHEDPARERGSEAPLHDGPERLGSVLRTRAGVKPIFVSVGHRVGLRAAVRAVLRATPRFRLPEPIRQADARSRAMARRCVCPAG